MPYTINLTDGTILTDLLDNSVDKITTDLALVGKNTPNYGEYFNENFIKLLENFANSEPPKAPLKGQIWYDTSEDKMKIYNGTLFKELNRPVVSATEPSLQPGDFWINNQTRQLYFNDGSGLRLAGPIYTAQQGVSGHEIATVIDEDGVSRIVVKLKIANMLVGVFVKEAFTPNYNIGEGKILSSEGLSGALVRGFNPTDISFKFNVTAKNAENLVDAFGNTVNVDNFVKTIGDGDIDGRVSITGNNKLNPTDTLSKPLILGYNSNLNVEVQKNNVGDPLNPVRFRNNITDQNLAVTVRNSQGFYDAIFIKADENKIGINTNSPTKTLDINGDVNLRANLVTNNTSINIINDTATTLNFAGAGTTVNIGASTGTTTVKNNLAVNQNVLIKGGELNANTNTFSIANTIVKTINVGSEADNINLNAENVNITKDLNIGGILGITGELQVDNVVIRDNTVAAFGIDNDLDLNSFEGKINLKTLTIGEENLVLKKSLVFNGLGIIAVPPGFNRDFELLNQNVTTILFGADATTINIGEGNGSGNTNVQNNLRVLRRIYVGDFDGTPSYIDSQGAVANLFNDTAQTINFGGNAETVNIGKPDLSEYSTTVVNIKSKNTFIDGDLTVLGGDIKCVQVPGGASLFNTNVTKIAIGGATATIDLGGGSTNVAILGSVTIGGPSGEIVIKSILSTGSVYRGQITSGENTGFFDILPRYVQYLTIGAAAERTEIGKGVISEDDPSLFQPSSTSGVNNTSQLPVVIARRNLLVRDKLLIPNVDVGGAGGAGVLYKNIYEELTASQGIRVSGPDLIVAGSLTVGTVIKGNNNQQIIYIPKPYITTLEIGSRLEGPTLVQGSITSQQTSVDILTSIVTNINIGGESGGVINLGGANSIVKVPGVLQPAWKVITTLHNAQNGDRLLIDTTTNNVQIYLPVNPDLGDNITIIDSVGASAAKRIYVYRNGKKIDGATTDIEITTPGRAFTLVYTGTTRGWVYDNA